MYTNRIRTCSPAMNSAAVQEVNVFRNLRILCMWLLITHVHCVQRSQVKRESGIHDSWGSDWRLISWDCRCRVMIQYCSMYLGIKIVYNTNRYIRILLAFHEFQQQFKWLTYLGISRSYILCKASWCIMLQRRVWTNELGTITGEPPMGRCSLASMNFSNISKG